MQSKVLRRNCPENYWVLTVKQLDHVL
ncbi:uncharacterized protein METZ01_LOCUS461756, partial [marine metagenome]